MNVNGQDFKLDTVCLVVVRIEVLYNIIEDSDRLIKTPSVSKSSQFQKS